MHDQEAKFYVVWNPLNRNPVVKHATWESAHKEAHRIAKKVPGEKIYILEGLGFMECSVNPVVFTPVMCGERT